MISPSASDVARLADPSLASVIYKAIADSPLWNGSIHVQGVNFDEVARKVIAWLLAHGVTLGESPQITWRGHIKTLYSWLRDLARRSIHDEASRSDLLRAIYEQLESPAQDDGQAGESINRAGTSTWDAGHVSSIDSAAETRDGTLGSPSPASPASGEYEDREYSHHFNCEVHRGNPCNCGYHEPSTTKAQVMPSEQSIHPRRDVHSPAEPGLREAAASLVSKIEDWNQNSGEMWEAMLKVRAALAAPEEPNP